MDGRLQFFGICFLAVLGVICIMPVSAAYTGPCPIGTDGAPELRDMGLSSGALCRGACGIDCPAHRCTPESDIVKAINQGTADQGICTYTNVVTCNTHEGCRDHDECYDYCTEARGETSLMGECHRFCNGECFDEWGEGDCALWADMPGSVISSMGLVVDYTQDPTFDGFITFSDAPTFTPKPVTTTTTTTVTEAEPPDEEEESPFSEILKEKPKVQYSAEEWIKEAERARRSGDYDGAIRCYDAAESIYTGSYKDKVSRPASVDEALASIEGYKAGVYNYWPGHDAERKEAFKNSRELLESAEAKKKASSWDLPGFEMWATLLSTMVVLLFRRIRQ